MSSDQPSHQETRGEEDGRDGRPSGSYVTISHAASDISPEEMAEMIRRMNEHLAEGNHVGRPRERASSVSG